MKINKNAFTFVELIVVVVILAILGTIGFGYYSDSIPDSRDAKRKSDFALISSAMKSQYLNKGSYPFPENYFNILYDNSGAVIQGKLTKNIALSTLDDIPIDPKINISYTYSITKNRQEYQVAGVLENGDNPKAILLGNYKSVAKNLLPTIILATSNTTNDMEIKNGVGNGSNNRKLFVFNELDHNLVYSFEGDNSVKSDGTDFNILLEEAENLKVFSQNSSFETCDEIKDAKKFIGAGSYELRTSTGSLQTQSCN